ncbi:hypothetical protein [Paludibacterium denitrificans]|uniref:hypothetical protein n=1 Tax=Paludibacterium denitrificans TaxID=2675226 RepID=UPI002477FAF4|nr:hypothetical protein [Paludibacterium denitrificans]
MVVICIGGLIDGNLPLKLAELVGKVVPETRDIAQSQIPEQSCPPPTCRSAAMSPSRRTRAPTWCS